MGHHHHGGRGFRGGYGYGPVIIEEVVDVVDPNDLLIGAEKTIQLRLGPPPAVAAVPAPASVTPDAALADAATPPTPAAPPKFIAPVTPPKKSLVPAGGALAGGALGFVLGGPIGAGIGLLAGYFGGKAATKNAPNPMDGPAVLPPPKTAPVVAGEFGCDHTAGWSPHGDERMR